MTIRTTTTALLTGAICIVCLVLELSATDKISGELAALLRAAGPDQKIKVWIYFTDKNESPEGYRKAQAALSSRARARRGHIPLDWYDLPISNDYAGEIERLGATNVRASRWLNAASAVVTPGLAAQLADRPFVRTVDVVHRLHRSPVPLESESRLIPVIDSAGYGASFEQNHQLGIDSLHSLGLDGSGVLLAFLDTGYEVDHPVFDSLTITEAWDFINGDAAVDDDIDLGQTNHGTATLSACGGFTVDSLIGPAYKAAFLLAKTEIQNQEIQIEEDNWVFAVEWADSLGADIISSSLGYLDWYTYADMDGNTAVTTIAADVAASRGILVVISAGNEGGTSWHYINAPADADSVVAAGAVDRYGTIAAFSSFGPSADGRIKPELVALGVSARCADINGGYTYKSGTSLSAPLVSGTAALILQANPSLRGQPMAIRRRLIESADRYLNPDARYGYGLPDAVLAAGFGIRVLPIPSITLTVGQDTTVTIGTLAPIGEPVVFDPCDIPFGSDFSDQGDGTATLTVTGDGSLVGVRFYHVAAASAGYADTLEIALTTLAYPDPVRVGPNPFQDELFVYFGQQLSGGCKIEVFTVTGEIIYRGHGDGDPFLWPGTNQSGEKVASGAYIIRVSADGIEEKIKVFKL